MGKRQLWFTPWVFLPVEGWKDPRYPSLIGFFGFPSPRQVPPSVAWYKQVLGVNINPTQRTGVPELKIPKIRKCRVFYVQISLTEADDFDVEKVCEAIDPDKVWKTPGQAKFVWNGFVLRIFAINKNTLRIRL